MTVATERLLLVCPDRPGIIATTTGLLASHGANIVGLDEHAEGDHFAMRCSYDVARSAQAELHQALKRQFAGPDDYLQITVVAEHQPRVAIFCSGEDHCLSDLLWRFTSGELPGQVSGVFATVDHHRSLVDGAGIAYHHRPVTKTGGMAAHEATLLEELGAVDLVILARYMRILSGDFLDRLGAPAINIHHSFLPSFPGGRPYEQAHERGVKLIGATAHYVTAELDAGPIIEQDVLRVSHRQDPDELRRLGRDVEKLVLARAVRAHLEDRVALWGSRTVVF